jgi:hypothetical protein
MNKEQYVAQLEATVTDLWSIVRDLDVNELNMTEERFVEIEEFICKNINKD